MRAAARMLPPYKPIFSGGRIAFLNCGMCGMGPSAPFSPMPRFIANSGGATGMLDMKRIGEKAEILFADRQARHGLQPIWLNGKNGKEYRSTLAHKPIGGIFSMGLEERYRWKDSVQNPAEFRLFVADGVANGLRPWFTKFGGVIYDPRWLKPVAEMYAMYAEWEPYLRNVAPVAQVGLVYSQQTWNYYGGDQRLPGLKITHGASMRR